MDQENENSQWTYEYATSFSIGPMAGALLAGVFYNIMSYQADMIRDFKVKEEPLNKQSTEMSMITHSSRISTPTNNQSFTDDNNNNQ